MLRTILAAMAALFLFLPLEAQRYGSPGGTWTTQACLAPQGAHTSPTIDASSYSPSIGTSYVVEVFPAAARDFTSPCPNFNGASTWWLLIGASSASVPLPTSGGFTSGCVSLTSQDSTVQGFPGIDPNPPFPFRCIVTIAVPNDPALIGASVFHQWLWEAFENGSSVPPTTRTVLTVSDGVQVTIAA